MSHNKKTPTEHKEKNTKRMEILTKSILNIMGHKEKASSRVPLSSSTAPADAKPAAKKPKP